MRPTLNGSIRISFLGLLTLSLVLLYGCGALKNSKNADKANKSIDNDKKTTEVDKKNKTQPVDREGDVDEDYNIVFSVKRSLPKYDLLTAGSDFPEATLFTTKNEQTQVSELWQERPLVIEIGSSSCPIFASHVAAMEELAKEYRDQVDFSVLFTREAHPGLSDSDDKVLAHDTFKQKIARAKAIAKDSKGSPIDVGRKIYIDKLYGELHKQLGGRPNSLYIIGVDGVVSFAAEWNETGKVKAAIDKLLKAKGKAASVEDPTDLNGNIRDSMVPGFSSLEWIEKHIGTTAAEDFNKGLAKK